MNSQMCWTALTDIFGLPAVCGTNWLNTDKVDGSASWLLVVTANYAGKDPNRKVHVANMEPTWVLSAPGGPHVGPMNLYIRGGLIGCVVPAPSGPKCTMGYEDTKYKFQISYTYSVKHINIAAQVASHEHHGVSNHWQLDCLFIFFPTDKYNIEASHHWPLWCESTDVQ